MKLRNKYGQRKYLGGNKMFSKQNLLDPKTLLAFGVPDLNKDMKSISGRFGLFLGCCLLCFVISIAQAKSPWYTVHGNRNRTASANVRGVLDPVERFHLIDGDHPTNAPVGLAAISSPSAFPDGIARYYRLVSIKGMINYLQVINTQTGEVEYKLNDVNFGAMIIGPTVLSNGNVIVADYARVRMFTPDIKTCIWTCYLVGRETKTQDMPVRYLPMYGAEELPDGRLIVPTCGGMIYILEQESGNIISKFHLKSLGVKEDPKKPQIYLRSGPGYDGNLVFAAVYEDMLLLKYIPETGLVFLDKYHYGDNQICTTTPTIDSRGKRVFFASFPDNPGAPAFQYALNYDYDKEKLSPRWSYSGPEVQPANPECRDQISNSYNEDTGLIIFNGVKGISTAFLEETSGDDFYPKIVWRTPHGGNYLVAIARQDNICYSTDWDNLILYALSGDTGEPIWTMPIPGKADRLISASLKGIIAANDVIYYDYPNGLYAIEQNGVRAPSLEKETKNFFVQRQLTPSYTTLLPNYPNPFNPETWLPFRLAAKSSVTISIYNSKGQLIRAISLGNKPAGAYVTKDKAAYWDGKDSLGEKVSSGVYFYTLQAGEFRDTRKMVIMK